MSLTSISSSGMQVAAMRQDVAAGNIARSVVPGAARQAVAASATADGGVSGAVVAAPAGTDGTVTDLVDSLSARNDFQANAAVLARSDQMLGSLLDDWA